MASVEKFPSVNRRMRSYQEEVEHWETGDDLEINRLDFELLLRFGISLFETINFIDETWQLKVATEELDHSDESQNDIVQLYEWWLRPCNSLLAELKRFEDKDFVVTHAEAFRSAYREVYGILTPDEEFFSGEDLVTARDKAIDEHERGECESLGI